MTGWWALTLAAVVWPAKGAKVHASVSGHFDDRAPFEVNLVNAPAVGEPQEPLPLGVSPEVLGALNQNVAGALDGVLASLGLQIEHGAPALAKLRAGAKVVTDGDGDRRFTLELSLAGDNGLGGHHGGLDLRVRVHSLQRASDIEGHGSASVPVARSVDAALLGLRGALMDAVSTAWVDLHGHLDDDRTRPRAQLELRLLTDGLDAAQRQRAAELVPCVAALAEPISVSPINAGSGAAGGRLEVRLRRYDPGETQADFLRSLAGRVNLELSSNAKARCSTFGGPLQGLSPVVSTTADALHVRFESPLGADGGATPAATPPRP